MRSESLLTEVQALLSPILERHGIRTIVSVPDGLPRVAISGESLRQLLIATLGAFADSPGCSVIAINASQAQTSLSLTIAYPETAPDLSLSECAMTTVSETAQMARCKTRWLRRATRAYGIELDIPANVRRPILIVDDNQDMLSLMQRYLQDHFSLITLSTTDQVLENARRLQPLAITLDLMMPEQDGWQILQRLRSQPNTRDIPIVVCSVLRQADLALSLGADAFLEKPVQQEALLQVLLRLTASPPSPGRS